MSDRNADRETINELLALVARQNNIIATLLREQREWAKTAVNAVNLAATKHDPDHDNHPDRHGDRDTFVPHPTQPEPDHCEACNHDLELDAELRCMRCGSQC